MKTYLSNFLGATAEFLRPLSISVGIPLSLALFFWSRRPDAILICAQSRRLKVGAQTSQTVSRGRAANPLKASAFQNRKQTKERRREKYVHVCFCRTAKIQKMKNFNHFKHHSECKTKDDERIGYKQLGDLVLEL